MFGATSSVLQDIIEEGSTYSQRGDADAAYKFITSFEFILILHLMKEAMGITNVLCQALQQKSQDIVNAMHLVKTAKELIEKMRKDGWDDLLEEVRLFCQKHLIDYPNLSSSYIARRGRACHQQDQMTMGHYYKVEIFLVTLDKQWQELNDRFSKEAIELLTLSSSLIPSNGFKAFNIDAICSLMEKYYPLDFTDQEKINMRFQLQHFILDAPHHPELKNLCTLSELCRALMETGKSRVYYLLDRLLRLVLTLPCFYTHDERAFSAMKLVKTRLCNKMEDEYLRDSVVVHIEKENAKTFGSDSIIARLQVLEKT